MKWLSLVLIVLFAAYVWADCSEWLKAEEDLKSDAWESFETVKWANNIDSQIKTSKDGENKKYFIKKVQLPRKEGKHIFTFKTTAKRTVVRYHVRTDEPVQLQPTLDGELNTFFGKINVDGEKIVGPGTHEFGFFAGDLSYVRKWYKEVGKNYYIEDSPALAISLSLSSDSKDISEANERILDKEEKAEKSKKVTQQVPLGKH